MRGASPRETYRKFTSIWRKTHYPQQGVTAVSFPSKICRAVALCILTGALGLGTAGAGQPPQIKIFDAPGAGNTRGTGQGRLETALTVLA
jgi:hypothetical protein